MKKSAKTLITLVLVLTLVGALTSGCAKKDTVFPNKTINMIVPFSAGGGTDIVTRAVADAAKDYFPESLVIVNKTGAGGALGMGEGANAKPDGYTVTTITVELTILPPQNLASFTSADFRPILQINAEPASITVRADAPWNTVDEFIAYAKDNEGQIKAGNSGVGAIYHLAGAYLEDVAGVKFNHIPYEGAAPAIAALLGGHIDVVMVSPAEVASQVEAGQLKILAVAADERIDSFPDVPTLPELGYDVVIGVWRGLAVPADTPDDVVEVLREGFGKAVKEDKFVSFMENGGLSLVILDEKEYTDKINKEAELYEELINKVLK